MAAIKDSKKTNKSISSQQLSVPRAELELRVNIPRQSRGL